MEAEEPDEDWKGPEIARPPRRSWSERTLWLAARAPIVTAFAAVATATLVVITFIMLPPQVQHALEQARQMSEAREEHVLEQDKTSLQHAYMILLLANTEAARLKSNNAVLTQKNEQLTQGNASLAKTRQSLSQTVSEQNARLASDRASLLRVNGRLSSIKDLERRERISVAIGDAFHRERGAAIILVDDPELYALISSLPVGEVYPDSAIWNATTLRGQTKTVLVISDGEDDVSDDNVSGPLSKRASALCQHNARALRTVKGNHPWNRSAFSPCGVLFIGGGGSNASELYLELIAHQAMNAGAEYHILPEEMRAFSSLVLGKLAKLKWKVVSEKNRQVGDTNQDTNGLGGNADDFTFKIADTIDVKIAGGRGDEGDEFYGSLPSADIDLAEKILGEKVSSTSLAPADMVLRSSNFAPLSCTGMGRHDAASDPGGISHCSEWSEQGAATDGGSSIPLFVRRLLAQDLTDILMTSVLEEIESNTNTEILSIQSIHHEPSARTHH